MLCTLLVILKCTVDTQGFICDSLSFVGIGETAESLQGIYTWNVVNVFS